MTCTKTSSFTFKTILPYFWVALGSFLTAFAIDVFLIPNRLIDGGIVGIAMILSYLMGKQFLPFFIAILNLPFLILAFRYIGKTFVFHMIAAVAMFAFSLFFIRSFIPVNFTGDPLEVVVIGGAILGIGIGLVIRYGGCLDGTEILGLIINKTTGFTVGQVVLFCNVFIFGAAGLVFQDWHPPLLSLITYLVVIKVMDSVIVGLDETKSVLIISLKSKEISEAIMHELGLGLTIMYGRGGFSGKEKEILYVIAERLQLADLKDLIYREDPSAFIAIENLHEIANGNQNYGNKPAKSQLSTLFSKIFKLK